MGSLEDHEREAAMHRSNAAIECNQWAVHLAGHVKMSIDGDKWCCLWGKDVQNGVAGFGESPLLAMADFDSAMHRKLGE